MILDDHFLRNTSLRTMPHATVGSPPWDLFHFVSGRPADWQRGLEVGFWPWWAPRDLHLGFWRPLSSFTHWADFALWPDNALAMHVHSLLWLAALVLASAALYRRFHTAPWAAGLATLLFAIDDAHAVPIGWIANRNALIAAVFSALALLAHDAWRRSGARAGGWLAPPLLLLGLWGGELALSTLGFVVAHAVCFERRWRDRLLACLPMAAMVVAWRVVYLGLGYGAHGSGLYLDPTRAPAAFALAALERLPLLVFAELGGLPSDLWPFVSREVIGALLVIAVLGSVALALALRPVLRADATARFWALGTLLALLPGCATFPNDRLLTVASLGGAGLVAQSVAAYRRDGTGGRWLFRFLVVIHLFLAALLLPPRTMALRPLARLADRVRASVPSDLAGRTLVVVNSPEALLCMQILGHAASIRANVPDRLRCLGVTQNAVEVTRPSAQALVLRPRGGYFTAPMDSLVRARTIPFHAGDTVATTGFRVEVLELTPELLPAALRVTFDVPLESDTLRWVTWTGRTFDPFTPPAVGQGMLLPASTTWEAVR